ncbi:MAG: glycosyltransferase [Pseudomonadales bacterium]
MRILHVYRTYFPDTQGGLEETIRQICTNTQSLGVEARVLSLSRHPLPQKVSRPEAEVIRANLTIEIASCGMSVESIGMFREQATWADVIHYHFPWPFGDLLHFCTPGHKPSLVTYHSDILRQRVLRALYRPLMKRFLASVDAIACTSPNYFATSDVLLDYEKKTEIIPIGLDEQTYPQPSPELKQAVRDKYGDSYFLFVGVLRYYKGLHILLDALVDAPYRVIIVGSGPTEAELKQQAKQLNLTNVVFAGHVTDAEKVALFEQCRAVVFPSYLRTEAFGVTLLEGAMFGRPLISTEVGSGTSHVNSHETTGLVVTPGSSQELRSALDKLYFDRDLAESMGKAARNRFQKHFTGQLMGERYVKVYKRLTHRKKVGIGSDTVSVGE